MAFILLVLPFGDTETASVVPEAMLVVFQRLKVFCPGILAPFLDLMALVF